MGRRLTRVDIQFLPEFLNYGLRFGDPQLWEDRDRRRAFAYFAPRQTFAYVRWAASEYGPQRWRMTILRAGDSGSLLHRVPGVVPGGAVLLDVQGAARVKTVLQAVDAIEAWEIVPADIAPAYWTYVQNRILSRLPIRPYDQRQHRAWRARQAFSPC